MNIIIGMAVRKIGRKLKFGEETAVISFRVPVSKKDRVVRNLSRIMASGLLFGDDSDNSYNAKTDGYTAPDN